MNNERWEKAQRYSHIGMHSNNNYVYASQYETAFKILYKSDTPVDIIALPLLYNLRHYVELMLKYNIQYLYDFSGSKRVLKKVNHKLMPLLDLFKDYWELVKLRYDIQANDVDLTSNLEKLINKLDEIDENAMSFRYSHDKKDVKLFKWQDKVDVYELYNLYERAKIMLNHTVDVFDDSTGLMDSSVTKKQLLSYPIPKI